MSTKTTAVDSPPSGAPSRISTRSCFSVLPIRPNADTVIPKTISPGLSTSPKKRFAREKLGLILETCEKYDVDGFELDFQRGAWYFKEGTEHEGMPLLTDFMRKVRTGTRKIAERKGRPFILMARIPPTLEWCSTIGLDAATWIKEDLADLFVPMHGAYLDMGADVRGFVELARGTHCRIGGGLEHLG